MKKTILNCTILLLLFSSCNSQTNSYQKTLYNENFKWTFEIPENFIPVSLADWKKIQNKGADAIENTYGEKIVDQPKTIFVFKNEDLNYIESSYHIFDVNVEGDYLEYRKNTNKMAYEMLKFQMPTAIIDSSSNIEKISNLKFQTFKIVIHYPNGMIMYTELYSYLFDDEELSVNIVYLNENQGKKMHNSWVNSKFE